MQKASTDQALAQQPVDRHGRGKVESIGKSVRRSMPVSSVVPEGLLGDVLLGCHALGCVEGLSAEADPPERSTAKYSPHNPPLITPQSLTKTTQRPGTASNQSTASRGHSSGRARVLGGRIGRLGGGLRWFLVDGVVRGGAARPSPGRQVIGRSGSSRLRLRHLRAWGHKPSPPRWHRAGKAVETARGEQVYQQSDE